MNRFFQYWSFTLFSYSLFLIGLLPFSWGQSQMVQIESYFEPSAITLSNNCVYKVIIQGSQNSPKGAIPSVPGLEISNNPQTFRKVSLINGVTSIKLELSFSVRPKKEGTFNMPTWPISIDGKSYNVPATPLRVLAPSQQDIINQQKEKQQQNDLKQAAFIEFSMPRDYVYVGETVVSEVGLFLWDRMPFTRIENAPVKESEGFSATELGQPAEKRNVLKHNKSYTTYAWKIGLTSTSAGKHSLSYHSNVRIRTNSKRSSPFHSPFFNDPFFGFGREESIKISSDQKSVEVRPLPTTGRPISFGGAIGTFKAKSKVDLDHVSLGDPVRLTFSISGRGNFTAMPAPSLEADKDFKVGPPAFLFEGDSQTKFEGTQNFEYVITPIKSGLLNIPELNFSYFDPNLEEYQLLRSSQHTIRVDPGEKWIDQDNSITEDKQNHPSRALSTNDFFQTESEPGSWTDSFIAKDLRQSPTFWAIQIIPFSAFGLLILIGLKKRNRGIQSPKQQESKLLNELKKSVSFNDTKKFYRCYRSIIQFKVGILDDHPSPYTLSSDEVIALLKKTNRGDDLILKVRQSLTAFDDFEFAGEVKSSIDLKDEFKKAIKIIKEIK